MKRFILSHNTARTLHTTSEARPSGKGHNRAGRPRKELDDPDFPRELFDAFGIKVLEGATRRKSKIKG